MFNFDHAAIMGWLDQLWDLININNLVFWLLNLLIGYLSWLVLKRLFRSTKEVIVTDE
jgi:hypothetical protein